MAARTIGTVSWFVVLCLALLAPTAAQDTDEARLRFGFVGLHGGVFHALEHAAEHLGLEVVALDGDLSVGRPPPLDGFDAVFVQHLVDEHAEPLQSALIAALAAATPPHVFSVTGLAEEGLPQVVASGALVHDPVLEAYYVASGAENLERLLEYVAVTHFGRAGEVRPPVVQPTRAIHHPEHDSPFAGLDEFLAWSRTRARVPDGAPRAAVVVHHIHRVLQQPRVLAAIVDALERRGVLVAVFEDDAPSHREQMVEFAPLAVVHLCHGMDDLATRLAIDAPHLHSVFFRDRSIAAWVTDGRGFDASTTAFQLTSQELLGAIEPVAAAGTSGGIASVDDFEPIPERIEHLADRTRSWMRLREIENAQKRIALVYYNREMGKGDLMRGSATGMYMNAPRSMINVLRRMADDGYAIDALPEGEEDLLARLVDHGQQIGMWDQDALDRLARSGEAVLLPVETYTAWLEEHVSAARRRELDEKWGPAPGRVSVHTDENGERSIVIPVVRMGDGVVLLPQPMRGEAHDPTLSHDRLLPPTHAYLATYFWLQYEWRADALVHFGTHGTEFLLPGRPSALGPDDWCDMLVGALPNVTPWAADNLGESTPVKRRVQGVLVSHAVPPSVTGGLSDELATLHTDIERWGMLEAGPLRDNFARQITEAVDAQGLAADVDIERESGAPLTDDEIRRIGNHLHDVEEETRPVGLHTFGVAPPAETIVPYVVVCLGRGYLDALERHFGPPPTDSAFAEHRELWLRGHGEELVELVARRGFTLEDALVALGGRLGEGGPSDELRRELAAAQTIVAGLARTHDELDNLMRALEGRFVPPGPGGTPDRNPNAVPTGRNLFLIDPEEVPRRASWELGKQLADELLRQELATRGRYPRKVAFTLDSFATFLDFGVMESQILWLLGVRPVWDSNGKVRDVELVPASELGRPRIDVFVAAQCYYRDILPTRMLLIDAAVRLVADLDEAGNAVFASTRRVELELAAAGVEGSKRTALARARIFSNPPGQMGDPGYYYLVERSGEWETREELMSTYLAHAQFVYTEGLWGEEAKLAYERQIQETDVVLRSWSDRSRSPLSNKYDWYTGGSLARAVQHLTGAEPRFVLSDVRDEDDAGIVDAEAALRKDFRVRLFNRAFIESLMAEGYAGADQLAVHVSNTLGWEVMRDNAVEDDLWEGIVATLIDDRFELGLREWYDDVNPYALQDMTEVMLESVRKGYWPADAETVAKLANVYADSVRRHGESGGLRSGGNVALERFVDEALRASGAAPLERASDAAADAQAPSQAPGGEASGAVTTGAASVDVAAARELVPTTSDSAKGAATDDSTPPEADVSTGANRTRLVLLCLMLALFVVGFVRAGGARREGVRVDDTR